ELTGCPPESPRSHSADRRRPRRTGQPPSAPCTSRHRIGLAGGLPDRGAHDGPGHAQRLDVAANVVLPLDPPRRPRGVLGIDEQTIVDVETRAPLLALG